MQNAKQNISKGNLVMYKKNKIMTKLDLFQEFICFSVQNLWV